MFVIYKDYSYWPYFRELDKYKLPVWTDKLELAMKFQDEIDAIEFKKKELDILGYKDCKITFRKEI